MLNRVFLCLGLVSMAACGGGDDDGGGLGGPTCAEVAATIGACGGDLTEAEFNDTCEVYSYPDGCLEAINGADCAEHDSDTPSYLATCFPSCDAADPAVCNDDDSITVCFEGTQYSLFCEAVCQMQDVPSAYTGTCAAEYMDMASSTGGPVCWCE